MQSDQLRRLISLACNGLRSLADGAEIIVECLAPLSPTDGADVARPAGAGRAECGARDQGGEEPTSASAAGPGQEEEGARNPGPREAADAAPSWPMSAETYLDLSAAERRAVVRDIVTASEGLTRNRVVATILGIETDDDPRVVALGQKTLSHDLSKANMIYYSRKTGTWKPATTTGTL